MRLKQSKAGRIYIKAITKRVWVFPLFVILGMTVILLMMANVKIDLIKTYEVKVIGVSDEVYLAEFSGDITTESDPEHMFIYNMKNAGIYRLDNLARAGKNEFLFEVNSEDEGLKSLLKENAGKEIKADVPVGKISLLEKIFSKNKE